MNCRFKTTDQKIHHKTILLIITLKAHFILCDFPVINTSPSITLIKLT